MSTGASWKLTLILLAFSSGVSIAVFTPIAQVMQQAGMDPRAGVVPFAGVVLVIHFVLFRNLVNRLAEITTALDHLRQNQPVMEIPAATADALKPLADAVNGLIRERHDLRAMRGQLVEQISAAAAQEERNRLARDLHDSIKQQVFSMSISAAAAHAHLEQNPEAARAALLDVRQSAQEAMVEMRALLQQLSPAPLEKSGLIQALREQCEALAYRTGALVETHFGSLPPDDQLPPGTQEALFRIAQEALSNIARHARARQVRLTLDTDSQPGLLLRIVDDGQGFQPGQQTSGMGLTNIHTRAAGIGAQVEVATEAGKGTELTVTVPFVEALEQETTMQAQYDTQLKPVIALYYQFAVSTAVFIVSASMLLWRVLARPDGIGQDTILTIISIVLAVAAIGSLPFAGWSLIQARPRAAALIRSAGRDSRTGYQLRRNRRMVYLIISLACAWFLPILAIGLQIEPWLRVAIGIGFLGFGLWQYKRMGDQYQQELGLLPLSERIAELDQRIAEIRSGWVTVGILVVVVLASTAGSEVLLPPQEPDHWMNLAFVTLTLLLLANQVVGSRVYRRWRQEAEKAAA